MTHLFLAIREGIVEHRKALAGLVGTALGLFLLIQVIFFFASTSPSLCGSCHIMEPYIAMWRTSAHRDVSCVTCHTEYRYALSRTYLKYAFGLYTPQLRAEVRDARCLSCHRHQDLDTDKPFLKNIHFSHKSHLGEMRRGKSLSCTSCHSGHIVMGAPASAARDDVQREVCFTCHFKGAEKGQAVTGCLVCHGPPSKVVTHQGFQFDHGSYLKRDVRCDLCHVEVTRGDANVPRERCATCHVSRIEAYDNPQRVHEIHLKRRQIDCLRCHGRLEHGKVAMAPALGERCEACHRPQHTQQEEMYIGIGGQGVPDTPSTMFLARVSCDSCHGRPGGDPKRGAEQLRTSCVTCHGKGFDRMVDDWINEMASLVAEVSNTVVRAEVAARAAGDRSHELVRRLERARANLDFVRRARGEHNIRYAVELLRVARAEANDVLLATGAGASPPPPVLASASGHCRVCHSTSHLGTRLPFQGLEYDHNRHITAGLACERCHSLEQHGKTTASLERCMACHHGREQKRTCETCHPAQTSLYKGVLAGTDVRGEPDVMAKAGVECTGCHDLQSKETLVKSVQQACVGCHEKGFDEMAVEWINEDQKHAQELAVLLARAQARSQGEGGPTAASHRQAVAAAERIARELLKAKGVHNTGLSGDAYARATKLLSWTTAPAP